MHEKENLVSQVYLQLEDEEGVEEGEEAFKDGEIKEGGGITEFGGIPDEEDSADSIERLIV